MTYQHGFNIGGALVHNFFLRNHSKATFNHPFVELPLAARGDLQRAETNWLGK